MTISPKIETSSEMGTSPEMGSPPEMKTPAATDQRHLIGSPISRLRTKLGLPETILGLA